MNVTVSSCTNSSSSVTFTDSQRQLIALGATVHTVNLILSLPTNSYVMWLIVAGVKGTSCSEFFALNLAVSEVLFCFSNVLYLLFVMTKYVFFHCAQLFFNSLLLVSRPLFQSCVSVERYLAVVHPVVFLRCKPLRYRVACCTVVWLLVLGCCFGAFFGGTNESMNDMFLGFYLFIFLVLVFCCVSVLRALKQSGPGEGKREGGRQGENSMKRKAFNIILIISMSMFLNYMSFVIVLLMRGMLSEEQIVAALYICISLTVVTGFTQPLMYLHRAGKLPCIKSLRQTFNVVVKRL